MINLDKCVEFSYVTLCLCIWSLQCNTGNQLFTKKLLVRCFLFRFLIIISVWSKVATGFNAAGMAVGNANLDRQVCSCCLCDQFGYCGSNCVLLVSIFFVLFFPVWSMFAAFFGKNGSSGRSGRN